MISRYNELMKRKELIEQYDRFIDQVRTEAKDLYWLYNFFFVIESAMVGAVFLGRISNLYIEIAKISGFLLSIYWFMIIRKQRMWRNNWVQRIQAIEEELDYPRDFQMWRKKNRTNDFFKDYILGKKGMWRALFLLPAGFGILWIILLFK